ncbi:MAG: efflux RND transporter periplasmic adaptor subunit [Verrucomicrobiae bacterium]|nr:efflux RND transporter periplasmic adaptor subunit [Verrucomicrobiae bacterium]MCP5532862.1 efflux RND transporter periplasmic adaptor subunit [Akkermansiaceae bacterium]MCP5548799.1 efflux RND transporter periplasmic adaptor subunit [Akkermansiaceae bacterium]
MKLLPWLLLTLPLAAQEPKTAPAVAGPWTKSVILPAEAHPYFRARVGTAATGWVGEVRADIGSRVKKGDLLAAIDAPELSAAAKARAEEARAAKQKIAQAASLLRSAEAAAEAAKSETARISRLAATGTVTSKARDEAEARSAAAEAKVGEAEAAMAGAEAEALAAAARQTEAEAALAYTKLTAPFDGLVVERHAEAGDFLGPDSMRAKLFVVEQTDPLRVRLEVPEHAAALTDAGDFVTLKLGGREFATKLGRVSGSLDPVTRTVTAEVDLAGSGLLPGTFGSATIAAASLEYAVVVPLAALRTEADGSRFVMVLDGSAETKVPVTLFATDGSNAILSQGPANGAKVLVP